MKNFKHYNADSIEEASIILRQYQEEAKVIAGGTDILGTLKDKIHPLYLKTLVNLKSVEGMDFIDEGNEYLRIGALVKVSDLANNSYIKKKYSMLAEAAKAVASPAIRNMATISGNICQEPRCWYYRNPENTFNCLRKGGEICNALTGENRYHSIFGSYRVGETPCASECPASTDIPAYMSKIREGDLSAAAKILLRYNPIPAVTGRVCPHFCQNGCNRGDIDESVSVRCVERFLGDYILDNIEDFYKAPLDENGKSVAILGSGPAGLSAAYFLRQESYQVVIFERMEEAGGMLMYGIPQYRLPKEIVRKQVEALKLMGVEFRMGVDVGKDVTLEKLQDDFDNLFLASGTWGARSIGLSGEENLTSGVEFLKEVNKGNREVPGKNVLVIGGGNVAVDVAQTAKRLGAEEVTMACLESREEMPAFSWEVEEALSEGVKLMNSWGPLKLLKKGEKVSGMELAKCTSVFDDNGKFSPKFDYDDKMSIEADQIILAVGQRTELYYLNPKLGIENQRGLITADSEKYATSIQGIFAGGEVTMGAVTVIEAIASGQKAAFAIDNNLQGNNKSVSCQVGERNGSLDRFSVNCLSKSDACQDAKRLIEIRNLEVEDTFTLNLEEIKKEAERCYNCGCVASSPSDIGVALVALNARIKTTKRTIKAENFFTADKAKSTVLDGDEIVVEIQVPSPETNNKQSFTKFRLRKAIDFPIVSVAATVNINDGKVDFVRIVLGAVAPIPLRAREAEDFLTGRELNVEMAEEAAAITVKNVIPLNENAYKAQVLRALVKRALLS